MFYPGKAVLASALATRGEASLQDVTLHSLHCNVLLMSGIISKVHIGLRLLIFCALSFGWRTLRIGGLGANGCRKGLQALPFDDQMIERGKSTEPVPMFP